MVRSLKLKAYLKEEAAVPKLDLEGSYLPAEPVSRIDEVEETYCAATREEDSKESALNKM